MKLTLINGSFYHKYSLIELENMLIRGREIYVTMLVNYIKEEKEKRERERKR